ncbi:MAG: hypothetical protein IJF40_03845 [Clostridia bacterium]|nr:hypothetical protein [Clostridia bacterium]MBQ7046474.1 hypothetical protein [Oscillospiraceae bacterium]
MSCCAKCGKELIGNDIGLTKKLINKASKDFYCIDCLAEIFHCDVSLLEKKIEQYKNMGCVLFT